MEHDEFLTLLEACVSVPCIKVKQPWASWLFSIKQYEIRVRPNLQRGLTGIIATGWDPFFIKEEIKVLKPVLVPYIHHALIGFALLVGTKRYSNPEEFTADQSLHLNPPTFYREGCFAWIFEKQTPIIPLYYKHAENKRHPIAITLIGQWARVRVMANELVNQVEFFSPM
jgi:hypothetical protein